MIADPGAVRILRLLETPTAPLASAVEALGLGLAAAGGLNGEVPPSTEAAIRSLRQQYGELASQIKAIDTDNFKPKNEALAALKRMDTGLANLSTGIQAGSEDSAQVSLANAVRRIERAGDELDRAAARIT